MKFNFEENAIPKYRRIIQVIRDSIRSGELVKGSRIPSLNEMVDRYGLSQDTVMTAYNHLKSIGVVSSQVGKGYFIARTDISFEHRVFVLFDNFSFYKEDLFNAMSDTLADEGELSLHFHYNNPDVFRQLIENAAGNYSSYIIMPMLETDADSAIAEFLPGNQVYILDRTSPELAKEYPFVCQDFKADLLSAFREHADLINPYKKIRLLNKSDRLHIKQIREGIQDFCQENEKAFTEESWSEEFRIQKAELLICLNDRILVNILTETESQAMSAGRDFGLISYNETALKKVVGEGITTMSTDFKAMGKKIIGLILENKKEKVYNQAKMIIRKSI